MTEPTLAEITEKLAGYDPNALPVSVAQEIMQQAITPVAAVESVAVRDALDRILAVDVLSPINVPAHDNSAMDGYALRGSDLRESGVSLTMVGTAMAGTPFDGAVAAGECVRIMTGAVMPAGLDTVVPQELVKTDDRQILIPGGQKTGQHRRHRGEDLTAGKPALRAGKRISPADLGLLASLGLAEVPVRRRVRVAFFSSGDELRSIGEPLGPGQVYDSNRYTIYGMLTRLGIDVIDMGVVPDQPERLENAVRQASEAADAIISSGGVSVGEADFTRDIMARLGDVRFWTIAMRPGRPMAFGKIGQAWYFGLPGNPVAAFVCSLIFARPALMAMSGAGWSQPAAEVRPAAFAKRRKTGRREYLRGRLNEDGAVEIFANEGSGLIRGLVWANGLVDLPDGGPDVATGDPVTFLPFASFGC